MLDVRQLILEAVTGTLLPSDDDLERIVAHVSWAGFDPAARERVGGRLVGVKWRGHQLLGRDHLPPAEIHCLRHVMAQEEWPRGTTLTAYIESIRAVIRDPASGLFVSQYREQAWQLAIVHRSGSLRGPGGGE